MQVPEPMIQDPPALTDVRRRVRNTEARLRTLFSYVLPQDPVLRRLAAASVRTRPIIMADPRQVTQERYLRQRAKSRSLRRAGGGGLPLVRLCARHYVGPDGTIYAKAHSGALWPIT